MLLFNIYNKVSRQSLIEAILLFSLSTLNCRPWTSSFCSWLRPEFCQRLFILASKYEFKIRKTILTIYWIWQFSDFGHIRHINLVNLFLALNSNLLINTTLNEKQNKVFKNEPSKMFYMLSFTNFTWSTLEYFVQNSVPPLVNRCILLSSCSAAASFYFFL